MKKANGLKSLANGVVYVYKEKKNNKETSCCKTYNNKELVLKKCMLSCERKKGKQECIDERFFFDD